MYAGDAQLLFVALEKMNIIQETGKLMLSTIVKNQVRHNMEIIYNKTRFIYH